MCKRIQGKALTGKMSKKYKHQVISYIVQWGFDDFVEIVANHTGIEFLKRPDRYRDHWQKSNLDGTFAYSGVTDDF